MGHHKGFTERGVLVMKLSVESANKFYKTFVYCDSKSAKLFKVNKIPFHRIVVVDWLDEYDFPNWGLAKLETMLHQTEPYIHIDFDTILTKKFEPRTDDITWGYGEINLVQSNTLTYEVIDHLNLYYDVAKKYEEYKTFDYSQIANASTIIVNSPHPIGDVIKEVKQRIIDYKDIISPQMNMFIEQFIFFQLIKSKSYISNSFLSTSDYNDLNVYWMYEIQKQNNIFDKFINNGFIHWPNMNDISDNMFDYFYKRFIDTLNLIDNRDTKIIQNSII